jgi:16S rRNA (cytosine967-C5)-methyltransferase
MTARRAAYDALTAITRDGAYTSLALKEHLPASLSVEDRHFATRLVRTTLENLLRIDYALAAFMRGGRVHGSVRNILRLGACQLMYMDTAEYAAVGESVALAKSVKPQMTGFVNAVLRALASGKDTIRYPQGENVKALSIETSYPEWICDKYIRDFGFEFAQALLSNRDAGGTAVRLNTLKADSAALEAEMDKLGLEYIKGSVSDAYTVQGLADIENLNIYRDGWIAVQSQSAMRAVLAAVPQPGEKLLDACAAPGGKSAYAAALAGNRLHITAWDVHPHRVEMTSRNYVRLGVSNAEVTLHDASVYAPEYAETFDCVIVDAPCSAMGLMTGSPDIRYSRKLEDIAALAEKQYAILSTCARYVKPGGRLAYFTCSINREENEAVTGRFLKDNAAFAYIEKPLTLYPHESGSDGFYIAVMKRNE